MNEAFINLLTTVGFFHGKEITNWVSKKYSITVAAYNQKAALLYLYNNTPNRLKHLFTVSVSLSFDDPHITNINKILDAMKSLDKILLSLAESIVDSFEETNWPKN